LYFDVFEQNEPSSAMVESIFTTELSVQKNPVRVGHTDHANDNTTVQLVQEEKKDHADDNTCIITMQMQDLDNESPVVYYDSLSCIDIHTYIHI